jgi:hypothetical protein
VKSDIDHYETVMVNNSNKKKPNSYNQLTYDTIAVSKCLNIIISSPPIVYLQCFVISIYYISRMNIKLQVIFLIVRDIALNVFNHVCDSNHILLTITGYKLTSHTPMARVLSSLQTEPLAISVYVNHMA